MKDKTYVMELCEGRHEFPTVEHKGIFPERVIYKFRPDILEKDADKAIPFDCKKLMLFVSGLTTALLSVVAVCNKRGIELECLHKRHDGRIISQKVL